MSNCETCGGTREVDELVGDWPDSEHRSAPCPACALPSSRSPASQNGD